MLLMLLTMSGIGLFLFGLVWGVMGANAGNAIDNYWGFAWAGSCTAAVFGAAAWLLGRQRDR